MKWENYLFKEHWNKKFPEMLAWSDPEDFTKEYRPWNELYLISGSVLPQRKWLKENNYNDYALDFVLQDYMICCEFDGFGRSHLSPQNIQRDRKKSNDWVLLGGVMLRFPVQTVQSSMDYVSDEIRKAVKVWYEV